MSIRTSGDDSVAAIVVTYNRKQLLAECIDVLLAQSYPVDRIYIVNNCSTDGTVDMLRDKGYLSDNRIQLLSLRRNVGGAGGFYMGMKTATQTDDACKYLWIMDDDAIPERDALEELIHAADRLGGNTGSLVAESTVSSKVQEAGGGVTQDSSAAKPAHAFSFLASSVHGINGEPMNVPNLMTRKSGNGYKDWYRHLGDGMVEIRDATFVSLLIPTDAVRTCGLPCKEYFIWGDDSEYTMRLIRHYGKAYMVGASRICHKREGAVGLDIRLETSPDRIRLYRYFFRNNIINRYIYESRLELLRFTLSGVRDALMSLVTEHGLLKAVTVARGMAAAVRDCGRVRSYIEGSIKSDR